MSSRVTVCETKIPVSHPTDLQQQDVVWYTDGDQNIVRSEVDTYQFCEEGPTYVSITSFDGSFAGLCVPVARLKMCPQKELPPLGNYPNPFSGLEITVDPSADQLDPGELVPCWQQPAQPCLEPPDSTVPSEQNQPKDSVDSESQ